MTVFYRADEFTYHGPTPNDDGTYYIGVNASDGTGQNFSFSSHEFSSHTDAECALLLVAAIVNAYAGYEDAYTLAMNVLAVLPGNVTPEEPEADWKDCENEYDYTPFLTEDYDFDNEQSAMDYDY
jgi:hypothetical protein